MEMHEIKLSHTELRIVNRDCNGRVLCETTSGLPVFIYNPRYGASGPGSDAVAVPIDDVLADQLREEGRGWYTTPDQSYALQISLHG